MYSTPLLSIASGPYFHPFIFYTFVHLTLTRKRPVSTLSPLSPSGFTLPRLPPFPPTFSTPPPTHHHDHEQTKTKPRHVSAADHRGLAITHTSHARRYARGAAGDGA